MVNQEDVFSMHDAMEPPTETERKFQLFEERLRAMEGNGVLGNDIVIPQNFPSKFKEIKLGIYSHLGKAWKNIRKNIL